MKVQAALRAKMGVEEPKTEKVKLKIAKTGRLEALKDAMRGDFLCHGSAYGPPDMEVRPTSEWRQCPGAAAVTRNNRPV